MSIDKAVDSAVLESNLTAVADAIRAKTGGSDPLAFPSGMVDAIAGIASGGGGGLKHASGTVVPAEDMLFLKVTGLDFTPKFFFIRVDGDKATDGVAKLAGAVYCNGAKIQVRTNSNGASLSGVDIPFLFSNHEVLPDSTDVAGTNNTGALESGLYTANSNYRFKAGYTYSWEAWGE